MSLSLPPDLQRIFAGIFGRLDQLERRRLPLVPQLGPVAGLPWLVVASDGTGDFTSIKSAIDSLPTNTTANELSGTILVKASTSTYSDVGAGTISIVDKQVAIIGMSATSPTGFLHDAALSTNPIWALDGITGSGAARISLYAIDVTAASFIHSPAVRVTVERCNMQSLASGAGITTAKAIDCYFAASVFAASSGTYNFILRGCQLAAGFGPSGATYVNGSTMRIEDCLIVNQQSITLNSDNASGGYQFEFLGNEITVNGTVTWTFGLSGTEDHLTFVGNSRAVSSTAVLALAFTGSGHGPHLVLEGNTLPYTDVSVTYSAIDAAVSITGIYRSIGLSCHAHVSAVLDGRGSGGITLLALSSGASGGVYNVAAIPGGTTKAYAIAAGANVNIVNFANVAACATASTNAGTGNLITST